MELIHLMLAQSTDAQALLKTVIEGFNLKLAGRAQALKTAHPGVSSHVPGCWLALVSGTVGTYARVPQVSVWFWDSAAIFTTILDDPTKYGFADATSYGNADSFWGNDPRALPTSS